MIPIRLYENNIETEIRNSLNSKTANLFYFIPENTCVFKGYNNAIDEVFCNNSGIKIIDIKNEGGVIVSEPKSLAIGYIASGFNDTFNSEFFLYLCDFLTSKGLNVSRHNNDLIIDGKYKVASYSSRKFGDMLFYAFHVSYEVNLDHIKKLCTKKMEKIPKGLIDFNISQEEILDIFLTFSNNFNFLD